MKGIVLAGGAGTRLHPITRGVSKQLMPVYDKPMIYYPLSVLMLADIREILIITVPDEKASFERLLGDGSDLGVSFTYVVQEAPRGIAEALLIGADHIGDGPVALILGDNIFHGHGFGALLRSCVADFVRGQRGATLFGYPVRDPERYGVCVVDGAGRLVDIVEKPERAPTNLAVTGLYLYDAQAVGIAGRLSPSDRGELEITDVNRAYLAQDEARLIDLGRGCAWLDTGTPDSLLEAGQYVQVLEHRQGVRIACLEEIALDRGFIDAAACAALGRAQRSAYGDYVQAVALARDQQSESRGASTALVG
ncbi:glucose-1-phosphate thymidylyltransferase RfbA [Allonocardiopsis opalescens]|uniref:Glucose-1-phosphate thymidylyltransferase n=1 Tax=Allonocardiopsis opalescens TaxID=1144618 RepID=A0A2T0Q9C9_9ACTN|nr:glucose-1-phosphate thymidylyltransferase RfbA [Allonocardiopsis opalescens]PRY00464.1 glucose-1-phosphate thymidylyltransferase [Allonocardiopsis opalescens]